MENAPIPEEVTDVLKTTNIGYLTTISKKGDLYSYPVAFYYSDLRVYFVTPISAAKYKMIKENPTVSLIVDNKQLTTNACGAMIQGRAKIVQVSDHTDHADKDPLLDGILFREIHSKEGENYRQPSGFGQRRRKCFSNCTTSFISRRRTRTN